MQRIGPPAKDYFVPIELLQKFADRCHLRDEIGDIDRAVAVLVAEWQNEPATGTMLARPVRDANPREFCLAGLRVIRSKQIAALGFLRSSLTLSILLHGLLDPTVFNRADAIELANELCRFDPMIDLHVASAFLEKLDGDDNGHIDKREVHRVLELVEELSRNPRRVLPLLVALQKYNDSWVRSKLASMWARHVGPTPWVALQLQDPDPRIRANVVEGLWKAPHTSEKRHLLLRASKDPHQRVVGNALVGLALMGDNGVPGRLEALATHPCADFRATAAWAMGEIGNACFRDLLTGMRQDANSKVRQNALKALSRVRKNVELAGLALAEA
jgi:hypothetical protein